MALLTYKTEKKNGARCGTFPDGTKPERVPCYEPDGQNHWLTCEPKYEPLLCCKATIYKHTTPRLILDYSAEQDFLKGSSNRMETYTHLQTLKQDWEKYHMYEWFMNTMTKEEYDMWFRVRFLENIHTWTLEEEARRKKRRDAEEQTNEVSIHCKTTASSNVVSEENDSTYESDRLQNISEYGW